MSINGQNPIVALALSTATFAWYAAGQTEVSASTMDATATAPASGDLLISKDGSLNTEGWKSAGYTVSWDTAHATTLNPTAYTADAEPAIANLTTTSLVAYNYEIGAGGAKQYAGTTTPNSIVYTFYVKNMGVGSRQIKATFTPGTNVCGFVTIKTAAGDVISDAYIKWGASKTAGTVISADDFTAKAYDAVEATIGTGEVVTVEVTLWLDGSVYTEDSYNATDGEHLTGTSVTINDVTPAA